MDLHCLRITKGHFLNRIVALFCTSSMSEAVCRSDYDIFSDQQQEHANAPLVQEQGIGLYLIVAVATSVVVAAAAVGVVEETQLFFSPIGTAGFLIMASKRSHLAVDAIFYNKQALSK